MREHIEIKYRTFPLLLGTVLFAVCAAYLFLGPQPHGIVGDLVGGRERPTVVGAMAGLMGIGLTALFSFYLLRALLGLPAIRAEHQELAVFQFPIRRYHRLEVESVIVEERYLLIMPRVGRTQRVRLTLLADYDAPAARLSAWIMQS